MKDINDEAEVEAMVCMVIDHVIKTLGLDTLVIGSPVETKKRAELYRNVAKELNTLARHLDFEAGNRV